jgi:hypothetical protein
MGILLPFLGINNDGFSQGLFMKKERENAPSLNGGEWKFLMGE